MTTTDKISWDTYTTITCTLASLASSATVGRSFAAIDCATPGYDVLEFYLGIKTGVGSPANDKAVYLYPYVGDGTNFEQEESNSPNANAGYTINAPTLFRGPALVIPVATAAKFYGKSVELSGAFGGTLPPLVGGIIINFAGQALDSTEGNHVKAYRGGWYTNS